MKHITALILLSLSLACYSQDSKTTAEIYSTEYNHSLHSGSYKVQSLMGAKWKGRKIDPMLNYPGTENTQYVVIKDSPILLFKNSNPKANNDVAGKLWKSSFVELISIEYRKRYKSKTKNGAISHEVWKKVKINGEVFYTDYKLHDRIIARGDFGSKNQILLLIAQNDGYDGAYDLGYPEYFHFIAVDNTKGIIYDSGTIKDYSCNCEFGFEPNVEPIKIRNEIQAYIEIPGTIYDKKRRTFRGSNISFVWNGKNIIAGN